MADNKNNDRKSRSNGMGNRGNRKVGGEKDFFRSADKRLEETCAFLIRQGHVNVWDYGWSFFETVLDCTNKAVQEEREFQVSLHGLKLKK